jgi:hypothetical protein
VYSRGFFLCLSNAFTFAKARTIITKVKDYGVWRSSVARILGVDEAVGSNPATPIRLYEDHVGFGSETSR